MSDQCKHCDLRGESPQTCWSINCPVATENWVSVNLQKSLEAKERELVEVRTALVGDKGGSNSLVALAEAASMTIHDEIEHRREVEQELETSQADRRAVVREYVRGLNHLADRVAELKEELENAALEQRAEQTRMEDRE